VLYKYVGWHWIAIPWVPIAVIGTAVAFYLGFKNSQSYDRMWEARKIWGAIVNNSRSWGAMVNSFIVNNNLNENEIQAIKQKLIYRHIAWLYTLRDQLLVPTQWEHVSLYRMFGSINQKRRERHGAGLFINYLTKEQEYNYFFNKSEWSDAANKATKIISIQTKEIMELQTSGTLNIFHQLELQNMLNHFYNHQGMAERIKKFPFPRQFANSSFLLNTIFIFLLPLGLVTEFSKINAEGAWLMVPFTALVSWVYIVMELVGDYSENPFEGLIFDVPMLSICRTIEIDLLQIIGDSEIPKPIEPIHDVLM
jgi:putative membrane protein